MIKEYHLFLSMNALGYTPYMSHCLFDVSFFKCEIHIFLINNLIDLSLRYSLFMHH